MRTQGHRQQIVEPGLAGRFLFDEPAHLRHGCVGGEERKERIVLTRPDARRS